MISRKDMGRCAICGKQLKVSRIDGVGMTIISDGYNYYHWNCYWRKEGEEEEEA